MPLLLYTSKWVAPVDFLLFQEVVGRKMDAWLLEVEDYRFCASPYQLNESVLEVVTYVYVPSCLKE